MSLYIYQHLGLGDMIANNALIRYLITLNKKKRFVYIFCKEIHIKNIKFMYRDLRSIKLIPVPNDARYEKNFVNQYLSKIKKNYDLIKIGHEFYDKTVKLNQYHSDYPWHCTVAFYKQFGLPEDFRFKNTYWKRDYHREKRLIKKLQIKDKKFIFIHDDPNRNLIINPKIFPNIRVIKNDVRNLIFDYGMILERASEIHLIESSFRQMIETLDIKTKNIYLYKDSRIDYRMSLFNKKLNKMVGTTKLWKERKLNFVNKKKSTFFNYFFKS